MEDMKLDGELYSLDRRLPELQRAGLITRDETSKAAKPYVITDEGRRYLEAARQKAALLSPFERMGWADEVGDEKHRAIAMFIRRLPEFAGSDEARIQEVSHALAHTMGLLAPQRARNDAERPGR